MGGVGRVGGYLGDLSDPVCINRKYIFYYNIFFTLI